MNISKFTQKSLEAIQNCEKVAAEYGNQEIDQEHLIYSLSLIHIQMCIRDSASPKIKAGIGTIDTAASQISDGAKTLASGTTRCV